MNKNLILRCFIIGVTIIIIAAILILGTPLKNFFRMNADDNHTTTTTTIPTTTTKPNNEDPPEDLPEEIHVHTEVIDSAMPATCTKIGYTEGKHCSECNATLIAQDPIPLVAHTYDSERDKKCNVCGYKREAECVHDATIIIYGRDATCMVTGLTDGIQCKGCNEILTEQIAIPVKPHVKVVDAAIKPTCANVGWSEGAHCSVCSSELISRTEVPKLPHVYDDAIDADCNICGCIRDIYEEGESTQGLAFKLNSDRKGYTLVGMGTFSGANVIIPSTHNKLPVTSIGDAAFRNCASLESVHIPNSVTVIGEYAFYNCLALNAVFFEQNSKLTHIESFAFSSCESIVTINIPDSVATIKSAAFRNCTALNSIVISSCVSSIDTEAFYGCSALATVNISASVESIAADAFAECNALTHINVDSNSECYGVANGALYDKRNNSLVQYPTGRTDESYVIPNFITSIGSHAFKGCEHLTSVEISGSVVKILHEAFVGCTNLTTITFQGSVAQWSFIEFGQGWNKNIPVTRIQCNNGTVSLK